MRLALGLSVLTLFAGGLWAADESSLDGAQRQMAEAQAELMNAKDESERSRAIEKLQRATQASQDIVGQITGSSGNAADKAKKPLQGPAGGAPLGQADKHGNKAFSGDLPDPGSKGAGQVQNVLGQKPGTSRARQPGQRPPEAPDHYKNTEAGPEPGQVYYGRPPGTDVPRSERTTGDGQEGLPPGISIDGSSHALGRSRIASDHEAGLEGEGAEDKKVAPNTIKDVYKVECQRGSHDLEGPPPDDSLFRCLDGAQYCPSWNIYEPEAYLSCLKRRGYWIGGPDPGPGGRVDGVLYRCIYHPHGLGGARFRDKPRTRNPGWVDLDYSETGTGLYGDTALRRVIPCLAQYRYLQGRFDHDCVDSCEGKDDLKVFGGLRTRTTQCSSAQPLCGRGRFGYCLGNRFVCIMSPGGGCGLSPAEQSYVCGSGAGGGCGGPHPMCLENGTGAFVCSRGRWICSGVP